MPLYFLYCSVVLPVRAYYMCTTTALREHFLKPTVYVRVDYKNWSVYMYIYVHADVLGVGIVPYLDV